MNTNLSVQDLRKIAAGMQRNRLLSISFPDDNAPYHILLVNRLEGEESLSRDFRFVIEILSDNAKLDPNDFVGKLIAVKLLRNDEATLYFNGQFSRSAVRPMAASCFRSRDGPVDKVSDATQGQPAVLGSGIHGQTATIFSDYGRWRSGSGRSTKMTDDSMACQFDDTSITTFIGAGNIWAVLLVRAHGNAAQADHLRSGAPGTGHRW